MTAKVRMTADDLWRLGDGDVRRELVDGEIVEMTPVGGVHGDVTGRVYRKLAEHVDARDVGKVVVGDVGFVLELPGDPERVRAPDVAFIFASLLPRSSPERCPKPAELRTERLSRSFGSLLAYREQSTGHQALYDFFLCSTVTGLGSRPVAAPPRDVRAGT
jgi:putative restriction endonuclease